MKPYLSVIVPAYNEAKRLPLTLMDLERHLSRAEYSWEIVVVNDGSTDATADIVKRFSSLMPNLRLIDNRENHGKGSVVRQGLLAAKGNLRLFTDADNSTSVDQFQKMLPYFKEGYDVVIGSRAVPGAKLVPAQPFYRRLLGRFGNWFIRLVALRGIKDTQCGFKCFSETAAAKIFELARIDRWGFDVEALVLAKRLGFRIKEMPVTWVNDIRSGVGFGAYFGVLRDVLRVRWWLWRKNYPI